MHLLLLLGSALTAMAIEYDPMNADEIINYINSLNTTWKAGRNYNENTPNCFPKLGVDPSTLRSSNPSNEISLERYRIQGPIPESFDARTNWPQCKTISEIGNQGDCSSCWAFGTTGAMSDRICIHSNGTVNVQLSAQDLLACCKECSKYGCKEGGKPLEAWKYWIESGIVTGGPYGSEQGCIPYSIKPVNPTNSNNGQECNNAPTPQCTKECQESYPKSYKDDLYYGKSNYSIKSDQKAIQLEILNNGPVEAGFLVYEDFYKFFTNGIYHHVYGEEQGAHSVRIIGWGTENGTPYWLIANSWGEHWGEKGTFRMRRGNNECLIEENVRAGMPKYIS